MKKKDENFDMIMDLFGLAESQIRDAKKDYAKQQKKVLNEIDKLMELVEEIPVRVEEDD